MATQAAFFNVFRTASRDSPSPSVSSQRQAPSPTLTNPDMILPDYVAPAPVDKSAPSPLPPSPLQHAPTNLADNHSYSRQAYSPDLPGPSTPIIYGNGTMLSDIGEVTEAESIVGSPLRHQFSRSPSDGTPLRSSPTMGTRALKKRTVVSRARRLSLESLESTSTVHDSERAAGFADFDDSVSVDDSNFQGDDEESLASSFVDDTPIMPADAADALAVAGPGQGLAAHRLSTSSISKRAEQILANAKRRLDSMEGNLNRARGFSYSPTSDLSTPSPAGRRATIGREYGYAPMASTNHARIASDTGLPEEYRATGNRQRSASALGAAGGYRQTRAEAAGVDGSGGKLPHLLGVPHRPADTTLAPLSEDGDGLDPSPSDEGAHVVARSASVVQVRDLQDHLQGLRGKISSLKEQARVDSMKRRSLRSMRVPSPFTHAAWDGGSKERRASPSADEGSPMTASPRTSTVPMVEMNGGFEDVQGHDGAYVDEGDDDDDDDEKSVVGGFYEARETQPNTAPDEPGLPRVEAAVAADDAYARDDATTGYDDDELAVDSFSDSGDSLYHDTMQHPISHEDREDAFDYEHFFLHSAMGTIRQQDEDAGSGSDSDESDGSADTTRAAPMTSHVRRPSVDTFVTVDSFATAVEGRTSPGSTVSPGRDEDGFATPSQDWGAVGVRERASLGGRSGSGSSGEESARLRGDRPRQNSVLYRPVSANTVSALHRPSVSSFESTGTNRSFPLVNRTRLNAGMLTPGGSPEQDLKTLSGTLSTETASILSRDSIHRERQHSPAIQTLSSEDRKIVERVVASLGKCVLGLAEGARNDAAAQDEFRRRIDAARKALEGEYDYA
ncbi:hypothetical protein RJ55_06142 [Drechmeria coniospora]|nr:hypothetical protein RJ55_06142 [Drechmeria coniospora]